jgi:hypothetical protein
MGLAGRTGKVYVLDSKAGKAYSAGMRCKVYKETDLQRNGDRGTGTDFNLSPFLLRGGAYERCGSGFYSHAPTS